MLLGSVHLKNPNLLDVENANLKFGLPLAKGQLFPYNSIDFYFDNELCGYLTFEPSSLWEDGSVKWLIVRGSISLNGLQQGELTLQKSSKNYSVIQSPVMKNGDLLTLLLPSSKLKVDLRKLGHFEFGEKWQTTLLKYDDPITHIAAEHCSFKELRSANKVVLIEVCRSGHLNENKLGHLQFIERTFIHVASGELETQITVRNPRSALHPNGSWDLGDPNSVLINEIALRLTGLETEISHTKLTNDELQTAHLDHQVLSIFQASSGKANWQSRNHVDVSNTVPLKFKGYRICSNEEILEQGDQISPLIKTKFSEDSFYIEVEDFWQNFPSQITKRKETVDISLLGARNAEPIELQPGEQKTRCVAFKKTAKKSIVVSLSSQNIRNSHALYLIEANSPPWIEKLVDAGIDVRTGFQAKREVIDQYGWRNHGELYADHEAALSSDQPANQQPFISHYNNQYDPIWGMLIQGLKSGNDTWLELANDLANHVSDIDIYHTSEDKPEYSGGLFWHTDHYVEAFTGTHRTYSKLQPKDVYDDHAGGGGPGGQHCYTSGLLLHYFLTSSEQSKQALLSQCDWITNYYEGDGTLFDVLMSFKNRHNPGLKHCITGKYPLDRGTANYLNALLDRYELLGQQKDLEHCAHIVFNTISPTDDIAARQLNNIEQTWFYVVFLQAVCKFICFKERFHQNDSAYAHAVRSLVHYVDWMSDNEQNYLRTPEKLEFPNDTWTAQDLRKICVLNFAAPYLNTLQREKAKMKAEEIESFCQQKLENSDERHFTRVLCLIMQNGHFNIPERRLSPMELLNDYPDLPYARPFTLIKKLFKALRTFKLTNELNQFRKRFPKQS